jgi:hypothetical protein
MFNLILVVQDRMLNWVSGCNAANAYDDVYKLDSKNADWAFERGWLQKASGDKNRAINAFLDVVKLEVVMQNRTLILVNCSTNKKTLRKQNLRC